MSSVLSTVGKGMRTLASTLHSSHSPSRTIPQEIIKDLGQTFDRAKDRFFKVGENENFMILELFDARDGSEVGEYGGFHGTTWERINTQVQNGHFENRNMPIYYDGFYTALKYAEAANGWLPCDMGRYPPISMMGKASFPLILRIASQEKPERNDLEKNPGLHDHYYFPASPNQKVRIVQAWAVNPLLYPEKLSVALEVHNPQIGLSKARAIGCFAFRRLGLIKY